MFSFAHAQSCQEKKIIVLEGLDGTGKSALARKLLERLGTDACIIRIDREKHDESVEEFYARRNWELTEEIARSESAIIILDRSWLSGEATRFAQGKGEVRPWPTDLYQPTHLFILTLDEEKRLPHLYRRQSRVPITSEEALLERDSAYRQRYLTAYRRQMEFLRTKTVCKELDGNLLTLDEMVEKIVNLLDVDRDLLDPRKMTNYDMVSLRPVYATWRERAAPEDAPLPSAHYYRIVPDAVVDFSEEVKEAHRCHFDHLGIVFDYNKFSEPRHPPVCIGKIENRSAFDDPFAERCIQLRDMPISFPTADPANYEYRIPEEYRNFREFIQKVVNVWHSLVKDAHRYYAYLTVSHGEVAPWKMQRRPGIHTDGFQSARVVPKQEGEYAFVASNALPTVYYVEPFDVSDLNPAKDDFFLAYSQRTSSLPLESQKAYDIMMMDPYCLHAAVINTEEKPVTRTFVRIVFSTRIYDRLGNTKNPAFDYYWEMVRRDAQADLSNRNIPYCSSREMLQKSEP